MIKTTVSEKMKGPSNAGKPVIMPTPMDVTTVQPPSQEDTQILTDEKKRRICTVIGVPVALVDYTDMAFQLSEEQARNFYDLTVIPEAEEMARVVNTQLMPVFDRSGAKLVLPIDDILNQLQDPSSRMTATTEQLAGGALMLNEARKKHQLPEVEGGNIFFFPSGVVPVPLDQLPNAAALIAASQMQPFGGQSTSQPFTAPPGMQLPAGNSKPPAGNNALPFGNPVMRPPAGNLSVHTAAFDQTPVNAVTVKQATPADELLAWKRKATKSGAGKPFVSYVIPKHVEQFVREELPLAADKAAIAAVFEDAIALVDTAAMKDYADTRAEFVQEMLTIIGQGQADDVSRQKFSGSMRTALRRYGLQAFQDGITEGSEADHESFSEDELTIFKAWNAETADYISGLSSELYKEGGITESEVELRADMWGRKSLNDIFYTGYRIGGANKALTWHIGGTIDHCDSCKANDGVTKTADEWGQSGFVQDRRLDCGGWKCECFYTDSQGNRVGY
jgi:hypothetical protein